MAKRGADGRNDHRIACIDRLPWLVIHPGARASRPASLFLQTACHLRPLPCKARQTRLYGVFLTSCQVYVRARRPRSRVVLCGRDARVPGWSMCGRDARAPGWGFFTRCSASTASMGQNAALMAVTTNESPALTAYPGWSSTRERGRLARILIPANSLPSAATPLQGAPNPPLRGFLTSCQVLCGRDARVPGWSCAGGTPRVPGWFCAGETPAFPGGLCAGETPAFPGGLVRAGRPRSRVVYVRARRPRSRVVYVRAGTPAFPGGFVRARRPRSRVVLCGRDARVPGWSFFLPPSRPLTDPSGFSSNPFVVLRG